MPYYRNCLVCEQDFKTQLVICKTQLKSVFFGDFMFFVEPSWANTL